MGVSSCYRAHYSAGLGQKGARQCVDICAYSLVLLLLCGSVF